MCVCVCMWSSLKQWELCGRTQNKIANNYKTSIFASHYVTDTLHDLFSSRSAKRYTTGQILKAKTQTSLSIPFFLNYGLFFFLTLSLSLYFAHIMPVFDEHMTRDTQCTAVSGLKCPQSNPYSHPEPQTAIVTWKTPLPPPSPKKSFFQTQFWRSPEPTKTSVKSTVSVYFQRFLGRVVVRWLHLLSTWGTWPTKWQEVPFKFYRSKHLNDIHIVIG